VVPEWCNDEFSHGEAFALLMRTDPKLTQSFANKLWIKFFLVAVYSTMWVRDHARKDFHNALGVDIDWYDQEVFRKTSTIAKQVFPMEIDIDHPAWIPNLNRMNAAMIDMERARSKGRAFRPHRPRHRLRPRDARLRAALPDPGQTQHPARLGAAGAVVLTAHHHTTASAAGRMRDGRVPASCAASLRGCRT
jgi:hypothetical protein